MTKRVCQVCGKYNHIDNMKKVGARYACRGLFNSCVKIAKDGGAISPQQRVAANRKAAKEDRIGGMIIGAVIGFGLVFLTIREFFVGVMTELGMDAAAADHISGGVSLATMGAIAVGLFILHRKMKKDQNNS